jgi:hypothetical protein
MAPRTLAGAGAAFAAVLCAGCCGSVDPTTWQGTLAYAFDDNSADAGVDAGDGGAGAKPSAIGSEALVVKLDAFAPWVTNAFDGSYCGSSQFNVDLGPECELTATLDTADWSGQYASDTGSADIAANQECTLTTPQGTFTVAVQGGTVGISGGVIDLVVDTQGANVEFQGNLQ